MTHNGMLLPLIAAVAVEIPEVTEVRTVEDQVIMIKNLNGVSGNTGAVSTDIQNYLIFRMDMEKAALIVNPPGPEAGSVIVPDANYFRYHKKYLFGAMPGNDPISPIKISKLNEMASRLPADRYINNSKICFVKNYVLYLSKANALK
jgi:hypothetical protein